MSQTHPPIPPGCEYFSENDIFGMSFHTWHGGAINVYPLEEPLFEIIKHPCLRGIIAAVAEVGWLREAERLQEFIDGGSNSAAEKLELLATWAKAKANAAAWREWGETYLKGKEQA
jgi:hypothetical protein